MTDVRTCDRFYRRVQRWAAALLDQGKLSGGVKDGRGEGDEE